MPQVMFRDDDISVHTTVAAFHEVHKLFIGTSQIHTVSLIVKDLRDNHEMWHYLLEASNLEWALHGWEHYDHGRLSYWECCRSIELSLRNLAEWQKGRIAERIRKVRKFLPPWHKTSEKLKQACEHFKLQLEMRSPEELAKDPNLCKFHYWSVVSHLGEKRVEFIKKRIAEAEDAVS